MNFFWEWHTGGGSGSGNYASRASMTDIYAIIEHAKDHDGDADDEVNWEDVDDGAIARFGETSDKYEYFDDLATDYGVRQ